MPGLAIVGASERNIPWTEWLTSSLVTHDYPGPITLVNPRHATINGRATIADIDQVAEVPEIGVLMVSAPQVLIEARKLISMGTRTLIVVSNGFGEAATDDGRALEAELRELCLDNDVLMVGPNCVGFASYHDRTVAISQPVPHDIQPGPVSVLSQSGGLTSAAMVALQREGLGLDMVFSLGNGASFGVADAISYCAKREETKIIVGVVESLGQRAAIESAVAEAKAAGKVVALLLLGASEGGRGVAASHTGAVVGERRLLSTWLSGLGVILADTPEQLGRIASLSLDLGAEPGGAFIATVSGGAAGITADIATRHGVELAVVEPATIQALRDLVPASTYVGNPLDMATGDIPGIYAALSADPHVGYLVEPWVLPWPDDTDEYRYQAAAVQRLVTMLKDAGLPVVIGSLSDQPLNDWMRELAKQPGVSVTPDLDLTLAALGRMHGAAVLEGDLRARPAGGGHADSTTAITAEAASRAILANAGLPVVAGGEYGSADEVVAAAGTGGRWVVKLSLDSVAHKERVGGVVLGVSGPDAVREACERIAANAIAAGVSDGSDIRYLLDEMVSGPEILVGMLSDPVAGPCITVAVGGWAAEAGAIFGTLALPHPDVEAAFALWGLPHLLGAERSAGLAGFVRDLGAAVTTGPLKGYTTIELNPVMLTSRGPVIVDALMMGG